MAAIDKEAPAEFPEKGKRGEARGLDGTRARYRAIGRELRRAFEEVLNEPAPAEFEALIKKLAAQDDDDKPAGT